MILDSEDQRRVLLDIIDSARIPGVMLEAVMTVKYEIRKATVATKKEGSMALNSDQEKVYQEEKA